MIYPIKIVDIELSKPMETISGLGQYMGLQGLVRLHGTPIGYIHVPITGGQAEANTISKKILEEHHITIVHHLLQNGLLANEQPKAFRLEYLFDLKPPEPSGELPLVTVAVCTRDRTEDLALCLEALCQLDYPHLELIVVDNAPSTTETELLVKNHYPAVRYVQEPRPGLDWARNRAIVEASGAIIAYTDDDVIVDAGWVKALAGVFAENPEAMAVTGLVVPYELETEAQVLFEQYGGFGKGFQRKWYNVEPGKKMVWHSLSAGIYGTGANMAFRCSVFDNIGYFDPALDVGTVTNGGGDIEMFFRILKEGYTLVYEPGAMVRHRHRREYQSLKTQITNFGSVYSYFICGYKAYPETRTAFLKLGFMWMYLRYIRRLLKSLTHPDKFHRELILTEFKGGLKGLTQYQKACKITRQIEQNYGPIQTEITKQKPSKPKKYFINQKQPVTGSQTLELMKPIYTISEAKNYSSMIIQVNRKEISLGCFKIDNRYRIISRSQLIDAIVNFIGFKLLENKNDLLEDEILKKTRESLFKYFLPTENHSLKF